MTILTAVLSYLRVRSFPLLVRGRGGLARWQKRRLARWLRRDLPRVEAFRGATPAALSDLPVMDKADLMADFSRYNLPQISNDQGWSAFAGSRRIGPWIVGASTGTSGNRGLFVISEAESHAWLGAILAKALPDFWRHRDRVAVLLPVSTPLYDTANRTGRLKLCFLDLNQPLASLVPGLQAFDPTILIAPPRILRWLAEMRLGLRLRHVFSGAETLDPLDRQVIEAGLGLRLGEIYMATEGLLGVTCRHGRLHLAEDCLHFEFEPAGNGLVAPIITDFSRRTQIMARYRMNDLLRLDDRPCPCGSPLIVVTEVVGREDDNFHLPGVLGQTVDLTPDILRNAIVDADRAISDFRLVQTGRAEMELHLQPGIDLTAVHASLRSLLSRHDVTPDCRITDRVLQPHGTGKLRRIRRDWPQRPELGSEF